MTAVPDRNNLSKFNVSVEKSKFADPNIGALYIAPDEEFSKITQATLNNLISLNQANPFKNIDEYMMEFCPDDLFTEKSFKTKHEAVAFIKSFFSHFSDLAYRHRDQIIDRLKTFVSMAPSRKKLTLRFEILSGNSCKKFHVDSVEARLIYTCAGPGTQIKLPESENFITLPTGSAIIAKGSDYPNFKPVTLHRSPPIKDLNLKRFLFIADFA